MNLIEDGKIEVVVVVSDGDVATGSHADPNGEVGNAFATDLPQVVALVVEHFHTVGSVVADEHFLLVVHGHTVGELKMPAELFALISSYMLTITLSRRT